MAAIEADAAADAAADVVADATTCQAERGGLLRSHRGFRLLFAADTISRTGTQVTLVALPLTAVLALHASAQQVGLLVAAGTVAFLLSGLPAGVWVDRLRRRPVMVIADLVRAGVLASVPLAAALGVLSMAQLYAVALLTGFGNVFFDVAQQSYIAHLLEGDRLVTGFSQLEIVANGSMLAGPTIGGWLVQLASAPGAIVADAVSYLASAGLLGRIRPPEPPVPPAGESRKRLHREISVGLRYVVGHPVLRMIALNGMICLLFEYALLAIQPLLLVRALGLTPFGYGLVSAGGAVGGIVAGVFANRVVGWLGTARSLWLPLVVTYPLLLMVPLVGHGWRLLLYPVGVTIYMFGTAFQNVAQVSYRQAVTPPHLRGRMNATMRFLMWGAMPFGGLLGGFLARAAGLWVTLWVCAIGMLISAVPMLVRSVRRLDEGNAV